MACIRWIFGSEQAASRLAHKALWTAVQSALGVLLADGLLDIMDVSALQTVAVAAASGSLTVLKEAARKQLATSDDV